jgi:23S rRNA (uracil1939-C5)-methyltransferase
VPGALPGETVLAEIVTRKKNHARATLLDIEESSPQRIAVACPYANRCPGCAYQHVAYEQEVDFKQAQLYTVLRRIGGIADLPDSIPVPSPMSLSYRNKIVMHAREDGKLGYYGLDNTTILDMEDCPLAVAPIREALISYRERIDHAGLRLGDRITFRWTQHDGVILWHNDAWPAMQLVESVQDQVWGVPVQSFWQVNPSASGLLLSHAQRMLAAYEARYLIDLYCGAGFFSLGLCGGFERVLGVEIDKSSIQAANENARSRGVASVTFVAGDATRLYPQTQSQVRREQTCVLVDPPRGGLSRQLVERFVSKDGPAWILYVSCAADTLARDCKALVAGGFVVCDLQMIDMFPRTAHFETLVLLRRQ